MIAQLHLCNGKDIGYVIAGKSATADHTEVPAGSTEFLPTINFVLGLCSKAKIHCDTEKVFKLSDIFIDDGDDDDEKDDDGGGL